MPKKSEVREAETSTNPDLEVGHVLIYDDEPTGIDVDTLTDLEAVTFAARLEAGDQIADYDEVHPRHDNTGPEHDIEAREAERAKQLAKEAEKARAALKKQHGFR